MIRGYKHVMAQINTAE